jgi:hypothetical protein
MRGVTADQVDRFLHHLPIDYPASKEELLRAEQAREQRHHGPPHLSQYEREVPKPPVEDEPGH